MEHLQSKDISNIQNMQIINVPPLLFFNTRELISKIFSVINYKTVPEKILFLFPATQDINFMAHKMLQSLSDNRRSRLLKNVKKIIIGKFHVDYKKPKINYSNHYELFFQCEISGKKIKILNRAVLSFEWTDAMEDQYFSIVVNPED